MSTGSFSTTTASSEGAGESVGAARKLRREGTVADGDDSDPEDSETPWVCTLKVRRGVVAAAAAAAAGTPTTRDFNFLSPTPGAHFNQYPTGHSAAPPPQAILQPQVLRIKVGTLSPTPHHPKVVAMLKVPFPLPDVEVERMGVIRRRGFPIPGVPQSAEPPQVILPEDEDPSVPYTGITLTAEEIKDMVCSTGLWLVVREGFGGVGRVSRKGDGWRIRA
ncbi:hypothetical protein BDZ97DRAFT_1654741 [Flammula alnicola]|nr:hypothetical protein BDZ97DRAFT_1654741 [Flammula alnicola]